VKHSQSSVWPAKSFNFSYYSTSMIPRSGMLAFQFIHWGFRDPFRPSWAGQLAFLMQWRFIYLWLSYRKFGASRPGWSGPNFWPACPSGRLKKLASYLRSSGKHIHEIPRNTYTSFFLRNLIGWSPHTHDSSSEYSSRGLACTNIWKFRQ